MPSNRVLNDFSQCVKCHYSDEGNGHDIAIAACSPTAWMGEWSRDVVLAADWDKAFTHLNQLCQHTGPQHPPNAGGVKLGRTPAGGWNRTKGVRERPVCVRDFRGAYVSVPKGFWGANRPIANVSLFTSALES